MGNLKKVTFAAELEVILGPPTDSAAVPMVTEELASVSDTEEGDGSSAASCNGEDIIPTADQHVDVYASYITYLEISGQLGGIDDYWDGEVAGFGRSGGAFDGTFIETQTPRRQTLAEEVVLAFLLEEEGAQHLRRNRGSICVAGLTIEESIFQEWRRVLPPLLHQKGRG